ncbi:MAG: S-adenosylmethionine:tRNA ribosyltransferase-isomerase [Myxococcales bacterium]|nr:S-adenosylmethionine:tRNA ribosyltransferase-isomerase [Myxococcales bacterium]
MAPAASLRDDDGESRLLVVEGDALQVARIRDLPRWVGEGDVVVVNDAATLPASLRVESEGRAFEVRLLTVDLVTGRLRGVLFGDGDHRTRTEDRPPPPEHVSWLRFGEVVARVVHREGRLVELEASRSGDALVSAVYLHGRPVQYAHVPEPLPLWAVQTPYASRPWALEMPSAGRALSAAVLAALRSRGATVARLTHAAGLSATGDPTLDARLPLAERYEIPVETVRALEGARRVIAIGTSVVRALEDSATRHGRVASGSATATLRLSATTRRRVVDAVLTGVHEKGTTHAELLRAFVSEAVLDRALDRADALGLLGHELGDFLWVVGEERRARLARPGRAA